MSSQQNPTVPTMTDNDNSMSNYSQSDSHLMSLPLEVLLSVTSYLPTPDYCNVRLVSKYFEEQLHNAFSKEFFTKRQFMITPFSLQALIDISKSRFSSTLRNVIIGLERPHAGPNAVFAMAMAADEALRSLQIQQEYRALINSGHHVDMLTEAFKDLPNLETVGLRDFNSRTRFRDAPRNEWRSYGENTWLRETGTRLEKVQSYSAGSEQYLHQMLLGLLRSLGASHSRPKHFEFILRGIKFSDEAFHVPLFLQDAVIPVLTELGSIFLDVGPGNNSSLPGSVDSVSYPHLSKFLTQTPNLEHLRLNFISQVMHDTTRVFLEWFAKCPGGLPLPPQVNVPKFFEPPPFLELPRLRQLDIGLLKVQPQLLLSIIEKYQSTLEVFSLHKVCLLHPDNTQTHGKSNLWVKFFNDISSTKVELTAINMTSLQQAWGQNNQRRDVTFKDSKPRYVRKWAGSNMRSALRDFANQVVVKWEPKDSASESEAYLHEDSDVSDEDDIDNDDIDLQADSVDDESDADDDE